VEKRFHYIRKLEKRQKNSKRGNVPDPDPPNTHRWDTKPPPQPPTLSAGDSLSSGE